MNLSRSSTTVTGVFAALLFFAPDSAAQEPELLYLSGSPGPNGILFHRFDQFVINESGSHFLAAPVVIGEDWLDAVSRDGHPILVEGQSLGIVAGAIFRQARVGSMSMNRAGDLAWSLDIEGAATKIDDQILAWNDRMLAREGSPVLTNHVGGTPFTAGTAYRFFSATHLNDRGQVLVLGTLNDDGFKGGESYASVLRLDVEGRVLAEDYLAVRRYPLAATGETVDAVINTKEAWALNDQGDWIGQIQVSGTLALVKNGLVVLRTGQESPAHPGRNAAAFSNLGMNNLGDFVVTTILDGNPSDNSAIVLNTTDVIVTEGDSFPGIAPHRIVRFDGAPVRICDDGAVFWYAGTDNPDPNQMRCYFRSIRDASGAWVHRVLVQQGVTKVGDVTVQDLRTNQLAFDVSDDGRFWLGEVAFPRSRRAHSNNEGLLGIDFSTER